MALIIGRADPKGCGTFLKRQSRTKVRDTDVISAVHTGGREQSHERAQIIGIIEIQNIAVIITGKVIFNPVSIHNNDPATTIRLGRTNDKIQDTI